MSNTLSIEQTIIKAAETGTGVVCKFRFSGIRTSDQGKNQDGTRIRQTDIEMFPVYHNNDKTHENYKFWQYSPNGDFKLSTVNQAAVDSLELGKEYYIYIVKAPEELNIPK